MDEVLEGVVGCSSELVDEVVVEVLDPGDGGIDVVDVDEEAGGLNVDEENSVVVEESGGRDVEVVVDDDVVVDGVVEVTEDVELLDVLVVVV